MLSDVERAVFGATDDAAIDAWLDRLIGDRLAVPLEAVEFRAGRAAAVYGCRLATGDRVVVKAHRPGADAAHLDAAVRVQEHLFLAGFPCPRPLDGPIAAGDVAVVIESTTADGTVPDAHRPGVRRALAAALAQQVALTAGLPTLPLRAGAPAWARYAAGPWPRPHDPRFRFDREHSGYAWLDDLAARAATRLRTCAAPEVIGHLDWTAGNVLVQSTAGAEERVTVSASFDWDSLATRPEPVVAGLSAGSHTLGGTAPRAPAPQEIEAFLDDYGDETLHPFTAAERAFARAAACWAVAYTARCELALLPPDGPPEPGTSLSALAAHPGAYLPEG